MQTIDYLMVFIVSAVVLLVGLQALEIFTELGLLQQNLEQGLEQTRTDLFNSF